MRLLCRLGFHCYHRIGFNEGAFDFEPVYKKVRREHGYQSSDHQKIVGWKYMSRCCWCPHEAMVAARRRR